MLYHLLYSKELVIIGKELVIIGKELVIIHIYMLYHLHLHALSFTRIM